MHYLYYNYEIKKLIIKNTNIANIIIFIMLACLFLFTLKKYDSRTPKLLSRIQTDQLKGIAILLVILGHLWVHVIKSNTILVFSGEAVALFLFLSGYGLTISKKNKRPSLKDFFGARIKRVMVPYWIITILLIFLDYLILKRTYSYNNLIFTFLGINVNPVTKHIDYVRWYITLLLLWYIIFFFAVTIFDDSKSITFLIICGIIVYIFEHCITHLDWYQIFAFPIGCTCAYYYENINNLLKKLTKIYCFLLPGLIVLTSILCKPLLFQYQLFNFPYIIIKLLRECNSILLNFGLIIFIALLNAKKYYSPFLHFCGKISYELFLLHGAFLIKYNPIIGPINKSILLAYKFIIFLGFIIILSYLIQKMINIFHKIAWRPI